MIVPRRIDQKKRGRYFASLLSATIPLIACLFSSCRSSDPGESQKAHAHLGGNEHQGEHNGNHEEEHPRGPHGGRLLTEDSLSIELQIFEAGVPPQFRIYPFLNGKPLSPSGITATITVRRFQEKPQILALSPIGDFLSNTTIIEEPHSFSIEIDASYQDKQYHWSFDSFEGRTIIPAEVASRSGITIESAVARQFQQTVRVRGKIFPSEHKIAHLIPRFSGIVRKGMKHIGDRVTAGETVAIIESNESLQPFELRSSIAGSVINGHLVVGEFVPENQPVYVVADTSVVWADFFVPLQDSKALSAGQLIAISPVAGDATRPRHVAALSYIAPYADERSQSQLVRAEVDNEDGTLLPGMFVTGEITVREWHSPVAVKQEAIQRFRDWDVVFRNEGETYQAQPVQTGSTADGYVEILSGLPPGSSYVSGNSFLIKADILKSGASHDH